MSLDYAERRIKEALKLTGGNPTRARQQVIAWTYEDSKLLHELTKNHLSGIVAYHVDRVESGRADKAKAKPPAKPRQPARTKETFGMEILKAVVDSGADIFGLEVTAPQRKRGQASEQHISAIKHIASKSKPKSTKTKK